MGGKWETSKEIIKVEHGKDSGKRGVECWARGPFKKGEKKKVKA